MQGLHIAPIFTIATILKNRKRSRFFIKKILLIRLPVINVRFVAFQYKMCSMDHCDTGHDAKSFFKFFHVFFPIRFESVRASATI